MTFIDWLVIAAGAAGIAWVLWYFFVAGSGAAPTVRASDAPAGGGQTVRITVRGGYDPATIGVRAGDPVRLVFDRQETSSCSEEVVFPDFGVRTFLPAFKETVVEVTPPRAGTYEFTCGMSMLHGRLVAE
jgi:plastocyanin domain-containing protein